MTVQQAERREFERLLEKVADSHLEPTERVRFEKLVQGNSARKKLYLRYLLTHISLEEEGANEGERDSHRHGQQGEPPKTLPLQKQSHSVSNIAGLSRIVGSRLLWAAVLLVAGIVLLQGWERSGFSPMAHVERELDPTWDSTIPIDALETEVPPNEMLFVKSGSARIDFHCGAQVVVQGPAKFEVRGNKQVELYKGKLLALCPTKETYGFTVYVPGARVVDLGTEFCVEVNDSADSFVSVLDGEVQFFLDRDTEQSSRIIRKGQALSRVNRSNTIVPGTFNETRWEQLGSLFDRE